LLQVILVHLQRLCTREVNKAYIYIYIYTPTNGIFIDEYRFYNGTAHFEFIVSWQVNDHTSLVKLKTCIGFGRSSLDQDVAELDTLIDFLSLQYEPDSFFLIGHSTGCQDAVTFFRKGRNAHRIRGIVLQAPVSDRDFLHSLPHAEERLKKAEEIYATQGPETLLNDPLFTSVFPVLTARRFLSLAQRLGDDDMFSYDLTDEELDARLRHMRNVPTYAIFSEKDEAVPDSIPYSGKGKKHHSLFVWIDDLWIDLAKRLCAVMGATCYMLSNANHAISNSEDCTREFIEQVVNFIEKVYSSTSE